MLPVKYPKTVQPLIPSYNYSDVDEGTGITTYYACTSENVAGEQYLLTTALPFSHLISLSGSLGTAVSFSGSFLTGPLNRPRIIKGTAVFNVTWRVTNSTSSNNNYPFVSLDKYDGSTYTNIGYMSGSSISSAGGVMRTTQFQVAGITPTLIKAGEQIRVKAGIMGVDAGNSPRGFIACDPQNRDDDWFTAGNFETTKLIANIPFKIVT